MSYDGALVDDRATNGGVTAGVQRLVTGLASGLAGAITGPVARRIPTADLDDRDLDYIRETVPATWLLASFYFRAEVRGLERIPAAGPVLLVGNHSGGNLTPDTLVFSLAFSTYFGVERRFFQLAHNLVLAMPGLESLRRYGTVAAARAAAGLNVGDIAGHIPLPAKITVQVLEPIDLDQEFGEDPDLDEAYDSIVGRIQPTADDLAAARHLPVIG